MAEASSLARRRTLIYLALAFGLAWAWWFAVVWPMAGSGQGLASNVYAQLAVGAGMLFPAIAVLITRLVTREGFAGSSWVRPRAWRRTWKYYAIGWLAPILAIFAGTALYFALNPSEFDPTMGAYVEQLQAQLATTGQADSMTAEQMRATGYAQLGLVLVAPLLNCVTCFGEEWGWRGYLLPKLLERHGMAATLVISGVVWGLWHAPITMLGHNYGLGYPGFPLTGIGAMCLFTTAIGAFLSYVTLRSGSCLPAVFAHGALNGTANVGALFLVAGAGNPFVGPQPTGIVGGVCLLGMGIACAVALVRGARRGQAQGPGPLALEER